MTTVLESLISEIKNLWGSFFCKIFNNLASFQKGAKIRENAFFFWDNCIWIGIVKLSLLRTGYFSSAANVLTSSSKTLHVNKREFFQLNWLDSHQWIWWRCSDADFKNAWNLFSGDFSKGLLNWETGFCRHLSDYVLGLGNFKNTKSMRVIFCFKIFKI